MVEIKIDKNFFIKLSIVIILCVACFLTGRFCRYKSIEGRANDLQQQLTTVTNELENFKREYNDRISECERLEQQLNSVGNEVEKCLGITRQLRSNNNDMAVTIGNAKFIVTELRKRIEEYETRIGELEENLSRIEEKSRIESK